MMPPRGNRGSATPNGAGRPKADDKYVAATEVLQAQVVALLALDVYDPSRAAAVAAFTKEANTWSGLYAPGGSSKRASGRAFYNALNQLQARAAWACDLRLSTALTHHSLLPDRATLRSTGWRRCRAPRWTR